MRDAMKKRPLVELAVLSLVIAVTLASAAACIL